MPADLEKQAKELPRFLEAETVVLHSSTIFAKRAIVLCVGLLVGAFALAFVVWRQMASSPNGQIYLSLALLPTILLAVMILWSFRASKQRKPALILTPKGFISSYNNLGTVPWDRVRFLRVFQDGFFPELVIALTEAALKERPKDDEAVRSQNNGGFALRMGLNQFAGTRQEILEELKPYLQAFGNEREKKAR